MRRPLCWVASLFVIVICVFLSVTSRENEVILSDLQEGWIEGIITEKEYKEGSYSGYWELTLTSVFYKTEGNKTNKSLEGKYICRMREKGNFLIGQRVLLKGKYSPFEKVSNPGQFDIGKWYCSMGIMGRFKNCELVEQEIKYSSFGEFMWKLRNNISAQLINELGEKDGSLVAAMLLGEKSFLNEDSKKLYQRNGISHILSISGLHLMMLGMAVLKGINRLAPSQKTAAVISIFMMIIYCIFTGSSISAVRATIMFILMMAAKVLGRTYDSLSGLAMAAILQLFINPYSLQNSGFLLSFLAVIGVTFVAERLEEIFPVKRKPGKSLLISMGASVTTLPVILSDYNSYPWYGIILNLFILPPMNLLLLTSVFLSFILSFFTYCNVQEGLQMAGIPAFYITENIFTESLLIIK